eukprot:NODE_4262_length_817_cov_12.875362_g4104_i0.p1 GENE.NODE_4262_length_817_cov_12.875362_g4104_i0~~NODE_4262_length_817_cov_12.875362_g4104_i0.p1  ORF type:complete len:231 (-),score=63.07 NODE_4262_length_817_cov_12.875362_g4104_i0:123-761(-)
MISTSITRLCDGLPLAASVDDGAMTNLQKNQAKAVLRKLTTSSNHPRLHTSEAGAFNYHILTQSGVIYLTFCERAYPTHLAHSYLEEVSKEFMNQYGREVDRVERPYAFIKFDTFLTKTKKLYMDTRTSRNIDKLKEDLHDVHQIFRSNIEEILGRGEKLETLSEHSSALRDVSKQYRSKAVHMNTMALLKKWAPLVLMLVVVAGYLYWKLH